MSYTIPHELFHPSSVIAGDHDRTEQAVTEACRDGRINALNINGRWAIPDSERQRLLRDGWPSRNPAVSKFWDEWREFRRQRAAAMEVA